VVQVKPPESWVATWKLDMLPMTDPRPRGIQCELDEDGDTSGKFKGWYEPQEAYLLLLRKLRPLSTAPPRAERRLSRHLEIGEPDFVRADPTSDLADDVHGTEEDIQREEEEKQRQRIMPIIHSVRVKASKPSVKTQKNKTIAVDAATSDDATSRPKPSAPSKMNADVDEEDVMNQPGSFPSFIGGCQTAMTVTGTLAMLARAWNRKASLNRSSASDAFTYEGTVAISTWHWLPNESRLLVSPLLPPPVLLPMDSIIQERMIFPLQVPGVYQQPLGVWERERAGVDQRILDFEREMVAWLLSRAALLSKGKADPQPEDRARQLARARQFVYNPSDIAFTPESKKRARELAYVFYTPSPPTPPKPPISLLQKKSYKSRPLAEVIHPSIPSPPPAYFALHFPSPVDAWIFTLCVFLLGPRFDPRIAFLFPSRDIRDLAAAWTQAVNEVAGRERRLRNAIGRVVRQEDDAKRKRTIVEVAVEKTIADAERTYPVFFFFFSSLLQVFVRTLKVFFIFVWACQERRV
jgi:hypothetical protein